MLALRFRLEKRRLAVKMTFKVNAVFSVIPTHTLSYAFLKTEMRLLLIIKQNVLF